MFSDKTQLNVYKSELDFCRSANKSLFRENVFLVGALGLSLAGNAFFLMKFLWG